MDIIKKDVLKYMYTTISNLMVGWQTVEYRYHHNSRYDSAVTICQSVIHSLLELNRRGIKTYSKDFLELMSDNESHINGNTLISLAVMGLDDIGPDDIEYNPRSIHKVDFLISDQVIARRDPSHYENEFLSDKSIELDMLKSVDIRLLKLIKLF